MNTPKTRTTNSVCCECGIKYLSNKQREEYRVSTFNKGKCGLCETETLVTSIRNYNFLNLSGDFLLMENYNRIQER